MEYGNVKTFVKTHNDGKGGTTIINYSGGTSNTDKLNAVGITSNSIETYNLKAKNAEISNANVLYLMSPEGKINVLLGGELKYTNGTINDFKSESISTNKLTVNDTAIIESVINNNLTSKNIVTDYLTVNKSAHFFELIIDKIRSIQGTQMNTAANCIIDFVQAFTSTGQITSPTSNNVAYYRIYWRAQDDDGRQISNDWLPLDQALCESFNVQTGTTYDIGNKYYWRKVIRTDNGVHKYVNLNTGTVRNSVPSDYKITFPNGFKFVAPDDDYEFDEFNITSQINGQWDSNTNTWTCTTTEYGLQLTYFKQVESTEDQLFFVHTPFLFSTSISTMLNVGIYYNDGTFDYFPADTYKTNYSITPAEQKIVEAIIINSAVIDKYEACNWIDLSNVDKDVSLSGKSAIPSKGDNICQLGFRYNELQNPTQDDIARASAIIIAAYNTPDAGIVPPSYAQYQDITDYSLATHRKSYFDATGCYIVGNFAVQASGSTIPLDQYIQQQTTPKQAELVIQDVSGTDYELCILQVDSNDEIHDMNNFPAYLNLRIKDYISSGNISVQAAYMNLFGRTLDLLAIGRGQVSDTANGIYLRQVTMPGTDYIQCAFDWRGSTGQVITNSSVIKVWGTVSIGGTTYNDSQTVPVAAVKSAQGTDAELHLLYKDTEYAVVQQDKSLIVQLRYGIQHIIGTSSTIVMPTTEKLKITKYNLGGNPLDTATLINTDYISTGGKTGNGYWEYTYTISNWYSEQNRPIYFGIELLDSNNNILDNTLVDIILDSSSLFTVEAGLTQSIQANTQAISDETLARTTQYTSISQTVNNINSTVQQHTSDINGMNVQISEIDQRANRIGLHVDEVEADVDGMVTNLDRTGIDIENGKITLTADNTVFSGNVNVQGNIHSGLFYSSCKTMTSADETNRLFIIDPSVHNYNMYFYEMNDNNWGYHYLQMPNANYWNGLELRVYWLIRNTNASIMNNRLYIQLDVNNYMFLPSNFSVSGGSYTFNRFLNNNIYTTYNSSNTVSYSMRTYPTLARAIGNASSKDSFALLPNVHYLFKAINGTWFMIDGLWTGE